MPIPQGQESEPAAMEDADLKVLEGVRKRLVSTREDEGKGGTHES
ncbi:MAG TPA: hypothetical protein VFA76_04785 [Terriglobales bacterium]|nr:hypothetical protein [Terriglobales bacterium]